MWSDRSFHEFVTQRQITDLVMRRVAEHVYDRPLINNVERADYVECLVELIMQSRPALASHRDVGRLGRRAPRDGCSGRGQAVERSPELVRTVICENGGESAVRHLRS